MTNLLMFDSISPGALPAGYGAYAGYVNGAWPDYAAEVARFPGAAIYSIDVNGSSDWADFEDIEKGDAVNAGAPASYRLRRPKLVRPGFYTSVANVMAMLGVLAAAGITRSMIRLWTAHYTGVPHLCGPQCGFGMNTIADGTQWTDQALGGSCDESLITSAFADTPSPIQGADDEMFAANPSQTQYFATCRFLWYSFRTDPITVNWQNLMWSLWNTALGAAGPFGIAGFGQDWDLVVANVHDTAGSALRVELTGPRGPAGPAGDPDPAIKAALQAAANAVP